VFVGAGILYLICQICCAATRSYAGMVVARFWVGCGSSVFSTMVGGMSPEENKVAIEADNY
jgi:predicted MFS family arabinose efflux permease